MIVEISDKKVFITLGTAHLHQAHDPLHVGLMIRVHPHVDVERRDAERLRLAHDDVGLLWTRETFETNFSIESFRLRMNVVIERGLKYESTMSLRMRMRVFERTYLIEMTYLRVRVIKSCRKGRGQDWRGA